MSNLYGRLGNKSILESKVKEARDNGATVVRDNSAGTVEATFEGATLFKAMSKGGGIWLIMYNKEFYPIQEYTVPTPS